MATLATLQISHLKKHYPRYVARLGYSVLEQTRRSGRTLPFWPEQPTGMTSVIEKICAFLGVKPTRGEPKQEGPIVVWLPDTAVSVPTWLASAVNGGCTDISKRHVASVYANIFGRSLEVEPKKYTGLLVEKSDANYAHDGRVLEGPIEKPRLGAVYQKLIKNNVGGSLVEDLRVCVVGQNIPVVYIKYRPTGERFSNSNNRAVRVEPESVLSKIEIVSLIAFSRAMNLDYGELDVLRDRNSGDIYVVDVAKTPSGPPNHLGFKENYRAVSELAECFESEFLM